MVDMADHVAHSEDFSALWDAQGAGDIYLERPLVLAPDADSDEPEPESDAAGHPIVSGDHGCVTVVDQGVRDGVARLAQAIAGKQVDVVRKGDLDALRAELEGTFTHQLAVALYEILAASNDRFAATEHRIIERMTECMGAHVARLVASMEEDQLRSLQAVEAVRSEVGAVRSRLNGPIDALGSFQRDVRHEVARVGDMVASDGATRARTADAELASVRRELTDRFERSSARVEEAAGGVSETITTVRDEVASLRHEIAELRKALESSGRRPRTSHWWSR